MNSKKMKIRKEVTDSKASEIFAKMLEKNNKNINNTNKQTLGNALGGNTAGNLPTRELVLNIIMLQLRPQQEILSKEYSYALSSNHRLKTNISTKNILIRSAKTGMENLQLVFKKSSTEIGSRIKTIPDVSGRFVQKIEFGSLFALLLRILLM